MSEIEDLRAENAKLLEHAQRLTGALVLAANDAHPTYSSTAGWRGGIGGQAMTRGCSVIDPPPGEEWTQGSLDGPAREFLKEYPFDLQAMRLTLKAELSEEYWGPSDGPVDE
ncbi:hypothetical protein SEA_SKOG_60 [Gordonia phage Skog]|uniref:Uncharacterized protein n=1 Tax=Gordonia phage Skog TaxID=2704033 RepID=A0A6G6XJD6_9CAUD|nr:hypothetical protein KHQ85_gp060 [Gordonia phage Skog]QIG58212.1 hypothetical protein SEA_SKOG_60 [Gordonia phage Skog]